MCARCVRGLSGVRGDHGTRRKHTRAGLTGCREVRGVRLFCARVFLLRSRALGASANHNQLEAAMGRTGLLLSSALGVLVCCSTTACVTTSPTTSSRPTGSTPTTPSAVGRAVARINAAPNQQALHNAYTQCLHAVSIEYQADAMETSANQQAFSGVLNAAMSGLARAVPYGAYGSVAQAGYAANSAMAGRNTRQNYMEQARNREQCDVAYNRRLGAIGN